MKVYILNNEFLLDLNKTFLSIRHELNNIGELKKSGIEALSKLMKGSQNLFDEARSPNSGAENISEKTTKIARYVKDQVHFTRISKLIQWENSQVNSLNNEAFWLNLKSKHSDKTEELKTIQSFWDKQKGFYQLSNEILLKAFTNSQAYLSFIDEMRTTIQNSWKFRLDKNLLASSLSAMAELEEQLCMLQADLINTMYCRLKVAFAMRGKFVDLTCDDVLFYVLDRLKELGVLKQSFSLVNTRNTLDIMRWNDFYTIIQRYSQHCEIKQDLTNIPWNFSSQISNKLNTLNINGEFLLIPDVINPFFSQAKSTFNTYFLYKQRALKLARENQAAILQLATLPLIADVNYETRFEQLQHHSTVANLLLANIYREKPKFWQIWLHFGYSGLLSNLEEFLIQRLEFCLHEEVKILEEISCDTPSDNFRVRRKLWNLCQDILENLGEKELRNRDLVILNRIEASKRALEQALQLKPDQYALCVIEELEAGRDLASHEKEFLQNYLQASQYSSEQIFTATIAPKKAAVLNTLLRQISDKLNSKQIIEKEQIESDFTCFNFLATSEDQEQLQKVLLTAVASSISSMPSEHIYLVKDRINSLNYFISKYADEKLSAWWKANLSVIGRGSNVQRILNSLATNFQNLTLISDINSAKDAKKENVTFYKTCLKALLKFGPSVKNSTENNSILDKKLSPKQGNTFRH